jgi:hypothetical protein
MKIFLTRGCLAACVLLVLVVLPSTASARRVNIGVRHLPRDPNAAAIVFGGSPVIPMTMAVTIYPNGEVRKAGAYGPTTKVLVSPKTVAAVLKLAEADGFFSLPATLPAAGRNVDNGPTYIIIHTTTGTKRVTREPFAKPSAFDELWSVLNDITSANMNCSSPPNTCPPKG